MTNWLFEDDKKFYDEIRRDFESAKINENTMSSILARHRRFISDRFETHAGINIDLLNRFGYSNGELSDVDGWVSPDKWLETRLEELVALRKLRKVANGLAAQLSDAEIDLVANFRTAFYSEVGKLMSSGDNDKIASAQLLIDWFREWETNAG